MIITCEKNKLNSAVQAALRGISGKVTMPILSGLLFTAENGRVAISSTDLEISVRAELDAEISESGSTVVSGRLVGDILKNLPGGDAQIETDEKFLTIKSSGGEYRIREMMPEDFPRIPKWEGESFLKAPGGEFMVAVQQASKASSSDEKRPVLTGMLVEKKTGESSSLKLVATDSYRLASKEIDVVGSVSEWENCIVPVKTMNEVARLIGGIDAEIEIKMQEKQILFRLGELVVASRLIEGQFPNYSLLIPKGEKTRVTAPKEELAAALKRALIFGHKIRVGIYSDHLRVMTETPDKGDSKEDVPVETIGEEMEIGFNGAYLLEGIIGAESENVDIRFDDPQKPALVKTENSEKYNYVLMPVRLGQ